MKTIYYTIFFSFLILGSACNKESLSLEKEYTLEIGETVSFDQGELEIHFDKVDDRRLPIGLSQRPIEEPAIVTFVIIENGEETAIEVTTFEPISEHARFTSKFGIYQIELQEVNPFPVIGTVSTDPYSIVFRLRAL